MAPDPVIALIEAMSPAQAEALATKLAPFLLARDADRRERPAPHATVEEAATFLRTTRGQVDRYLSDGRLTRIKPGMPPDTPRHREKTYRTFIAWDELERFAAGIPTGPVAAHPLNGSAI
jgi:hypothetical protein